MCKVTGGVGFQFQSRPLEVSVKTGLVPNDSIDFKLERINETSGDVPGIQAGPNPNMMMPGIPNHPPPAHPNRPPPLGDFCKRRAPILIFS